MLRKKIHRDSKTGDISHKDHSVVNMRFVAGVAGNLILGIALLMPGGVSQVAAGETLVGEVEFLKSSKGKSLKISKPKSLEVSKPKSLKISKPKSIKVSEPKSLEAGRFPEGKYTRAERENAAYLRCAALKEFDDLQKCALEALGNAQEEAP